MNDLKLAKKEIFGDIECSFYRNDSNDIWMTREQIGTALEYNSPNISIGTIHKRNSERLNKYSTLIKLINTDGKRYNTVIYNSIGIYEICRYSKQEKANQFFDWVYSVLEKIRKKELRSEQSLYFPSREEVKAMATVCKAAQDKTRTNPDWRMRRAVGLYLLEKKKERKNGVFLKDIYREMGISSRTGRHWQSEAKNTLNYIEAKKKGISAKDNFIIDSGNNEIIAI